MKPYKGNEGYIFISYSHKDKKEVFKILERMHLDGYRIWYDEGIDPGAEWDNNIAQHIKGCAYFISFVSENFIESMNCIEELSYARDLNKERLLIYLSDVKLPDGITMRTSRLQSIHKYKYNSFEDFISILYSAQGIQNGLAQKKTDAVKPAEPAQPKRKRNVSIILSAVLLAVLCAAIVFMVHQNRSQKATPETTPAEITSSTNEQADSNPDTSSNIVSSSTEQNNTNWKTADPNVLFRPAQEYFCSQYPAYVYCTDESVQDYVKMRNGPSSQRFGIANKHIPNFEKVIVESVSINGWTLCYYDGGEGWIRTKFLFNETQINQFK